MKVVYIYRVYKLARTTCIYLSVAINRQIRKSWYTRFQRKPQWIYKFTEAGLIYMNENSSSAMLLSCRFFSRTSASFHKCLFRIMRRTKINGDPLTSWFAILLLCHISLLHFRFWHIRRRGNQNLRPLKKRGAKLFHARKKKRQK